MTTEFWHGLIQTDPPIVAVSTGTGSITTSGTLYFWLQGWNAAGVTNPSDSASVTYAAGDAITINFPSSARTTGTHFDYYAICASATDDPDTGVLCALWTTYNTDGSERLLSTITLSTDEHLTFNSEVALPADLPEDPVAGMTRTVLAGVTISSVYVYVPTSPQLPDGDRIISASPNPGNWLAMGSPALSQFPIGGTIGTFGCAQPVVALDEEIRLSSLLFPVAEYAGDGASDPQPIYLMEVNRFREIPTGTRLTLQPSINGEPYSARLSGLLIAEVVGIVNLADGSLDTDSGTGDGADMEQIGEELIFTDGLGFWRTPKTIAIGYAVAVKVKPRFFESQVSIRQGNVLYILLQWLQQAGRRVSGALMFQPEQGGFINPSDVGTMRALPGEVGTVEIEAGYGIVKEHEFPNQGKQIVPDFLPNTANQKITITKDGVAICRRLDPVPNVEALLALVDFSAGDSLASDWSSAVTLSSAGGLQFTANYPYLAGKGITRFDYPDNLGAKACTFNVLFLTAFIRRQSDGVIFQLDTKLTVIAGESQVFSITSLAGASTIGSLPSPASDFCLFDPPTVSAVSSTAGTIPAGTYQIALSNYLNGTTASRIIQNSDSGCIPVLGYNLVDALIRLAEIPSLEDFERIAREQAIIFGD